jgi:signal transduction histidine kinase
MSAALDPIAVLLIEDSRLDAELARAALARGGIPATLRHVTNRDALIEALDSGEMWDVVLADYALPDFDGVQALGLVRERLPDVPFIFVSGTLGEELAVDMLHRGATDYVVKQRLERLAPSVLRAVSEARARREREQARSDLRAAEARARLALAAGRMAAWEYDLDRGVLVWSASAAELLGLAPAALGGPLGAFLACVDQGDAARVRDALTGVAGDVAVDFGVTRSDGEPGRVLAIGRRADGRFVGVAMDMTERRRAEEHLRRVQRLEAVGRLAGGVAHEANNQMAVVMGFADFLLRRDDLPDAARIDVRHILRAAERTAGITRQLLTFSRRNAGTPEIVSVSDQVRCFEPVLRRTIGERGTLRLELGSESRVRIDRGQLEQVLLNFVLNAADAIAAGGTVTISTDDAEIGPGTRHGGVGVRAGGYVRIVVADDGHGMDRETLDRVFEPFFTTKEVGRGSGLGLAAVYGIVKQADGYVWAASEPGRGARFEILLPRSVTPATAAATNGHVPHGAETVLVVDDEPGMREVAVRALQTHGYRALEAGDGVEALAVLRAVPIRVDLVVTDLAMPRMDGRQLASELRRSRPDLPVLFISGYADGAGSDGIASDGDGADGPDTGRTRFLAKPFAPDTLLGRVRSLLDG